MNAKFVAVRGGNSLSAAPYYIGLVQHGRSMEKKESYAYAAEKTGFPAPQVRATFLAMKDFIKENAARGNITHIDGVASVHNVVKGAFDGMSGPWVRGRNHLLVIATEMAPFKTLLDDVVPVNATEGAKPVINTVLDEVTLEYGVITGTDAFSVAGAELAPDQTKADEYVALVSDKGVETKATIAYSDLQNVRAALGEALPAGEYTLVIRTRCGMGEEFGVKKVTRKVEVK